MLAWPIQRNHAKCCRADPCCHGNEICARRGDLDAYRLVNQSVKTHFIHCCMVIANLRRALQDLPVVSMEKWPG